jgi:predicted dinucleotide-binding enzyme
MRFGIFGTGMVGETIGAALVARGHEVRLGSRTANNEKAVAWTGKAGARASHGTFADAAAFGEILFNCTAGHGSVEAIGTCRAEDLRGKVMIDVSNPLDFSKGMPPTLFVGNDDSLAERIQRAFPELKVVKSLNTVNAHVMVDAGRVPGEHAMFVSGDDAAARDTVKRLLTEQFGWKQILDLGGLSGARAQEAWLHMWLRLWGVLKTPDFNIAVVKA